MLPPQLGQVLLVSIVLLSAPSKPQHFGAAAAAAAAQLEVDEAVFFDEYKKLHPRGWANGQEGGAGLVAVLEKILGAPLAEAGKLTCDEAFKVVSAKWRGGPIPPPIFGQMLRCAASRHRRRRRSF